AILSEGKVGQTVQARVLRGQQIQVVSIPLLGPQAPASPPSIDARDNAQVDNPFAETLPRSKEAPALEPAPQSDRAPVALGVSVRPFEGARGVSVSEVRPGTPAFAAGLQPGDRIVSVDGRLTADVEAFKREIQGRGRGESLSLGLVRGQKMLRTTATLSPPTPTGKVANDGGAKKQENGSSVLGGIGSVLGGLFGGGTPGKAAPTDGAAQQTKPQLQNTPPRKSKASDSKDGLALGDDESVKPAGFEAAIADKLKKLVGDPPSLKSLAIPADKKSPIESSVAPDGEEASAEELREEIRKLQEKLKDVESSEE
ncbi:MAG: PDZ domain-containing protein, partial [Rubripirellula sp.]